MNTVATMAWLTLFAPHSWQAHYMCSWLVRAPGHYGPVDMMASIAFYT